MAKKLSSNSRKHKNAVVVCSIIGRKGISLPNNSKNRSIDFFNKDGYYLFSHDNYSFIENVNSSIIDEIKKELDKLRKRKEDKSYDPLSGKWKKSKDKKDVYERVHFPLGLYDPSKKTIILYEKNIEKCCLKNGKKIDGLKKHNYILRTFFHELAHADFHISNGKKHKYIWEIEETIAELYTLTILDELKTKDSNTWKDIHTFVTNEIKSVQDEIGRLAVYGFGATLYDSLGDNTKRFEFIDKFKQNITKVRKNKNLTDFKKFVLYPKVMGHQNNCILLLKKILQIP